MFKRFDSAFDFYQYVEKTPSTSQHNSSHKTSGDWGFDSDWYGTANFPEAIHLATHGWEEGLKLAKPIADRLSTELIETLARPQIEFDVTGEQFDMGRVIAEEPECWMKWADGTEIGLDEVKTGPIKIVLNNTVSSGISTEVIRMRGAAVMALALVFDNANRPTRVEVVTNVRDGYGGDSVKEFAVCLKDYYDPLQEDVLSFGLIHPSFFRRIGFKMLEIMGIQSGSYGMPQDTEQDKGDLYLGQALWGNKEWATPEMAEKWVREQLIMQGVRFTKV
jgi:hypothetical protein